MNNTNLFKLYVECNPEGYITEFIKILKDNYNATETDVFDINMKDVYGFSLLHNASTCGQRDLVNLLLSNGADISIATNDGCTPLHLAILSDHTETIKLLLKHARESNLDINIENQNGNTPLHMASIRGKLEIVQLLLESITSFDINAQNKGVIPSLFWASKRGHTEVVKLFLERGASKSIKNRRDETPIDIAKNDEIKRILENWFKTKAAI